MTSDIPCSVAELDQAYLLTGKVLMENHYLSIGIYESSSQSWNYTLVQTNSTGHFSTNIHWYSNDHSNYSYIMLSIVDSSGQYYDGWWTYNDVLDWVTVGVGTQGSSDFYTGSESSTYDDGCTIRRNKENYPMA